MSYDTLNPVPSTDPRDLYDNAAITDKYVNGDQPFVADRLGKQRRTWMGMEEDFNNAQTGRAAQFDAFLTSSAFVWLGDYGAGLTFTSRSQYTVRNGYAYRLADSTTLPYTTTGNWTLEQTKFSLVNSDDILRQDLSQPPGSGLLGFSEAQTYPSGTAGSVLKTLLRRAIFVAPIGGGADDAAAINTLMASKGPGVDLFFEAGAFSQSVRLTVPEGQHWRGAGGQRGTTFTKIANCDAIYVGNLARISDLNFEGVGATYTGKGIICEGYSGSVERCRANLMKSFALSFPGNAGGFNICSFEGSTSSPTTVAAIDLGGVSTVRPIFFRGIWLSGGFMDVTGSGNGCSLSEFYMTALVHGAGAGLMHFANGRVGNAFAPFVLSGAGSTFTGISFAGPVNITAGVGHRFAGCDAEITEDAASNSNTFDARGTISGTGWTQASGVAPSLGNGSLVMNYVRTGRSVTVQLALVFGSTTTAGDGAAPWTFALPFVATPNINADGMVGNAFDVSASTDFIVFGQIPGGGSLLNFGRNGAGVRAGTPFTWAAGDKLSVSLTYLVR